MSSVQDDEEMSEDVSPNLLQNNQRTHYSGVDEVSNSRRQELNDHAQHFTTSWQPESDEGFDENGQISCLPDIGRQFNYGTSGDRWASKYANLERPTSNDNCWKGYKDMEAKTWNRRSRNVPRTLRE